MSDQTPEPIGFETLRQAGVAHAQAASGNIWTDYNLHDPGVTLLEQTCFALTEVSYQASHAISDLLTDRTDALHHEAMGLFLPGQTLPSAPVTLLDLAAELSEPPEVARVSVAPGQRRGLLDITIVPAPVSRAEITSGAPEMAADRLRERETRARDAVVRAFRSKRPLSTDIDRIIVARRRPAKLSGVVQVTPTAQPDRVAAEIYYRVATILRGQPVGSDAVEAATRARVYDNPQTFLHAPSDQFGKTPDLENHLSTLREIPGVADIADLEVTPLHIFARQMEGGGRSADKGKEIEYLDLVLPATDAEIEVDLQLDAVPVTLDPNRIREEYLRVSADYIARAQHHLDTEDWREPPPGRRRAYDLAPVDSLLPMVYGTQATRGGTMSAFGTYRGALNSALSLMSADLSDLPRWLTARTDQVTQEPDIRRHRIAVLDYLIALQGEEIPASQHGGLHIYRNAASRQRFELSWRLRYLEALPRLNAMRGTGPNGTTPNGFVEKFRLLADLHTGVFPARPEVLQAMEVSIDAAASPPEPDVSRRAVELPVDPFALLVPHDDRAASLEAGPLLAASRWLDEGRISPDLLARTAGKGAFVAGTLTDTEVTEGHRVATLFDPGSNGGLYACAWHETPQEAAAFANRLRVSWVELQRAAEGAVLIESILLRTSPNGFVPDTAAMVMPGWTARTAQPAYRAYVARLIEVLAPACLHVTPIWLDAPRCAEFETIYDDWLAQKPGSASALSAFLVAQGAPV